MNLFKAIEKFQTQANNLSVEEKRSLNKYLYVISDFFGDIQVEEVMLVDIENFIELIVTKYIPLHAKHFIKPMDTTAENWLMVLKNLFDIGLSGNRQNSRIYDTLKAGSCSMDIQPFSKDELNKILSFSKDTPTDGISWPNMSVRKELYADAITVILRLLIDTGLRPSEISRLCFRDIDNDKGEVIIRPFEMINKSILRCVPIGKITRISIWSYFTKSRFTFDNRILDLNLDEICSLLNQVGILLGNIDCSPDRFRKTFAYLSHAYGSNHYAIEYDLGYSTIKIIPPWMEESDEEFRRKAQQNSVVDGLHL